MMMLTKALMMMSTDDDVNDGIDDVDDDNNEGIDDDVKYITFRNRSTNITNRKEPRKQRLETL